MEGNLVETFKHFGTDGLLHPTSKFWEATSLNIVCFRYTVHYISISRYRWLVNMWTVYGGRKDLAAISLQRQTMKVHSLSTFDNFANLSF